MKSLLMLVFCLAFFMKIRTGASDVLPNLDLIVEKLEKEVNDMKEEMAKKSQEIGSLQQTIADLKDENSEEIGSLRQIIADLKDEKAREMGSLQQAMQAIGERGQDQIARLDEKLNRQVVPVMFHARLSTDREFSAGTTIIFDDVETNLGNAYYPALGVFACPVSGYYFFYVNFLSKENRSNGELTMDGLQIQNGPLTVFGASGPSGQASQAVSIFCPAGSTVYMRAIESSPDYIAADLDGSRSSFTGFLVHPA